jgi:16S rRNA U516 pseudouridylate synthase RsuA-like enzyme
MCELVGLKVVSLTRTRIGSVHLGRLPRGKWRLMKPDEAF